MTALYIFADWCVSSIILAAILCTLITRGKMDSHRRDDRSGSDQPVGLGSHGERGAEIDFPHVERF